MSVSVVRVIRTPTPRRLSSSRSSRPDLEGDILLPGPAREEDARISRVHTAVAGIDGDDVSRAGARWAAGRPSRAAAGTAGREPGRHRAGISSRRAAPGVVPIPITEVVRKNFGDELERQEQRVAGDRRLRREWQELSC